MDEQLFTLACQIMSGTIRLDSITDEQKDLLGFTGEEKLPKPGLVTRTEAGYIVEKAAKVMFNTLSQLEARIIELEKREA